MADTRYLRRLIDPLLDELLAGLPAVLIAGPRASGKTTTARRLVTTTLRLDRSQDAVGVQADPDAVLRSLPEPILLDEWQMTPEVLGAVKRAVDDDPRPGRFVLTGSTQSDALTQGWPATGRVVRVTQWGLTRREIEGDADGPSFFDTLFAGAAAQLTPPPDPPDLVGYVERALLGGFPEVVLQPSTTLRRRWLDGYVDQLLTRDAPLLGENRDPRRLRRYLQALAANSAGVIEHKTLFDAAGIARMSAVAYDGLLDLLMLSEQLPAWSTNRLKRLIRAPKRFITDPSLLVPLLGIDVNRVVRDGDLLGRVIETFVLAQLRPERETSATNPTLFHLRTTHGTNEVDLVAETPDGRILGIEVKAGAAPNAHDARHLVWLRDSLPPAQFVAGVLLHTGPRTFSLSDRIHAVPIAAIWGSRS
jgi:predicted AAA+ superfamily ATPase